MVLFLCFILEIAIYKALSEALNEQELRIKLSKTKMLVKGDSIHYFQENTTYIKTS